MDASAVAQRGACVFSGDGGASGSEAGEEGGGAADNPRGVSAGESPAPAGFDDDKEEDSSCDEESDAYCRKIQARRDEREKTEKGEKEEFERVREPRRQAEANRVDYLSWDTVSFVRWGTGT